MEALPLLLVALVAAILWIYAAVQRRLQPVDAAGERERMERRTRWLRQRLDTARRERWDGAMTEPILADLEATNAALMRLEPTSRD